MKKDAFTKLQRAFINEYLKSPDLNGAECVRRAGYRTKYPNKVAAQLLGNTRLLNEIKKTQDKRAKRMEITQDRVLEELAILAFSDFRNYGEIIKELGIDRLKLKTFANIKGNATRAIKSISEKISKDGVQLKFKLHGKSKPIEMIGRHLGMFIDKVEHSGTIKANLSIIDLKKSIESYENGNDKQ